MGAVIQFNYADWAAAFPEFGNIAEATIIGPVLAIATQYCRIDGGSPIAAESTLTQALNLMVAHVAQIMYGSTIQPLSPLVGHITDATEGSVSVSVEFPTTPENAWFMQTRYGSMYWQLVLPFRLGRYVPKVTQQVQPVSMPWPYGIY